ncbi:DUF4265 domain-containing protein [Nonomuraea sp. NPDC050783]|uniref:DUF4265 domain-containing protein n=1 Tax=Nonomuraea sp. NPDC050783 TaxID=3154634 RepID=UPI003466E7CB
MAKGNYIARVDLGPFGFQGLVEQVWLKPIGVDTYQVSCIPFRVYGMSLFDEVKLTSDGIYVKEVVRLSGHRTLRLLLTSPVDLSSKKKILSLIKENNFLSEWSGDRHVVIDIPPGVDANLLLGAAGQIVRSGFAYWEWGDAQPFESNRNDFDPKKTI